MTAHGPTTLQRGDIVGLLDVGSAKVCCAVVAHDPNARLPGTAHGLPLRVLGFSHSRSAGVKAGAIFDLDDAEASIRTAIAKAERMADLTLSKVILSVACGRIGSQSLTARADIASASIAPGDRCRVMAAGHSYVAREGRIPLHMGLLGWVIDGSPCACDPVGMTGRLLEADLHAVTSDEAAVRNLVLAVERADVRVAAVVPGPLASALSAATPDERRLGVTVIDVGAGTTTIARFAEGYFLEAFALPMGGGHITYDIARGLSAPPAEAERIKTLYGSVYGGPSDEVEAISYTAADVEQGALQMSKACLSQIVRRRADQLLGLIAERLGESRFGAYAGARIVVTGGASQLLGFAELMSHVLQAPVRVGKPAALTGYAAGVSSPAHACTLGLGEALFVPGATHDIHRELGFAHSSEGYLHRVGRWFRDSF
jgi:cell division protein FtsA